MVCLKNQTIPPTDRAKAILLRKMLERFCSCRAIIAQPFEEDALYSFSRNNAQKFQILCAKYEARSGEAWQGGLLILHRFTSILLCAVRFYAHLEGISSLKDTRLFIFETDTCCLPRLLSGHWLSGEWVVRTFKQPDSKNPLVHLWLCCNTEREDVDYSGRIKTLCSFNCDIIIRTNRFQ